MATDRDDEIARRYRALATEEPGAALDAAILAKSRRAVGARPSGFRRWGPPLSIAAVLMLASGVVIRMQAEKPGLETSAPVREESAAPAAEPPATREVPAAAADAVTAPAAKVAPRKEVAPAPLEKKRAQSRMLQTSPISAPPVPAPYSPPPPPSAPAPAAAGVAAAPPPPAPQRAPMQMNLAPSPAENAPAADVSRASAAPAAKEAPRLKSERRDERALPSTPEATIDRIAALRAAGRDDEADRALEEFRRSWPDYRWSDAQLERVRRRAP